MHEMAGEVIYSIWGHVGIGFVAKGEGGGVVNGMVKCCSVKSGSWLLIWSVKSEIPFGSETSARVPGMSRSFSFPHHSMGKNIISKYFILIQIE